MKIEEQGNAEIFVEYLVISGRRCVQTTFEQLTEDGKKMRFFCTYRTEFSPTGESIFIDEPSDGAVAMLKGEQGARPLYHFRLCRYCRAKGISGWEPL